MNRRDMMKIVASASAVAVMPPSALGVDPGVKTKTLRVVDAQCMSYSCCRDISVDHMQWKHVVCYHPKFGEAKIAIWTTESGKNLSAYCGSSTDFEIQVNMETLRTMGDVLGDLC